MEILRRLRRDGIVCIEQDTTPPDTTAPPPPPEKVSNPGSPRGLRLRSFSHLRNHLAVVRKHIQAKTQVIVNLAIMHVSVMHA